MASTGAAPSAGRFPRGAGTALFAGVVLAYAAFAWDAGERAVLAAAAEEGRALVSTVSAGLAASLDASRAVEDLLAARALDNLRAAADAMAAAQESEETVLAAAVAAHGAWKVARERAGLSVATLAATLGSTERTLREWESNPRASPRASLLVVACYEVNLRLRAIGAKLVTHDEFWDAAP